MIYLVLCAAEDVTNQKRGVVLLLYFNRHIHTMKRVLQRDPNIDGLPVRFVSIHVCFNDPKLHVISAMFILMMGRERRVRLRRHEGTMENTGRIPSVPSPCNSDILCHSLIIGS